MLSEHQVATLTAMEWDGLPPAHAAEWLAEQGIGRDRLADLLVWYAGEKCHPALTFGHPADHVDPRYLCCEKCFATPAALWGRDVLAAWLEGCAAPCDSCYGTGGVGFECKECSRCCGHRSPDLWTVARVRTIEVRQYDDGGISFWWVHPDEPEGNLPARHRYLTPARAHLALKRAVLRLFDDVRVPCPRPYCPGEPILVTWSVDQQQYPAVCTLCEGTGLVAPAYLLPSEEPYSLHSVPSNPEAVRSNP